VSRFGFWHSAREPKIEYLGEVLRNNGSGSFSSQTFTGVDLGDPAEDREIFLQLGLRTTANRTISSAFIGGVSCTVESFTTSAGATQAQVGVIHARVPAGATGDIALTFSGNLSALAVGVYRVEGRPAPGASEVQFVDSSGGAGVTSSTLSGVNAPKDGFVLSACATGAVVSNLNVSGCDLGLDARINTQSSGGAIWTGVAHSPILAAALSSQSATWTWTTSTYRTSGLWVFS
jgi:hypothetical protein